MDIRERVQEFLYEQLESRIENRIRAGVDALHYDNGWTSGSFVSDTPHGEVRIVIQSDEENPSQATVYAENEDGNKSREWSIPTSDFEDGLESTAGAVFDVTLGEYA